MRRLVRFDVAKIDGKCACGRAVQAAQFWADAGDVGTREDLVRMEQRVHVAANAQIAPGEEGKLDELGFALEFRVTAQCGAQARRVGIPRCLSTRTCCSSMTETS